MRRLAQVSMILTATALLLSGCNAYNKMQTNVGQITATAVPEIVTLNGNVATTDVIIDFPPKYFYEEMILKITPVLVFEGGEIAGEPKYVVGEDVIDNYPQISWKHGGQYKTTVNIPYDQRASLSTLELRIEGRTSDICKNDKYKEFAPFGTMAVAQGVSTIQNLVQAPEMFVAPHEYSRITVESKVANLYYNVGSADVHLTNRSKKEMTELNTFINDNKGKSNVKVGNIVTKGYASPEGPLKMNNDLADRRAKAGDQTIKNQLKNNQIGYDFKGEGEDWAGFEKLLRESNIKDKDFVLQLIAMHSDVEKRESEIKNLGYIWNEIKKEILPPLRRAEFVVDAAVTGKTDAEVLSLARRGDRNLSEKEMLYAATMTNNLSEKVAILRLAANTYGSAAAYNNLGVALTDAGDYAAAKTALEKAYNMTKCDQMGANVATASILGGDYNTARSYMDKIAVDVKEHNGVMLLLEGNNEAAASYLNGYNRAVVDVANGNLAAAKRALASNNDANSEYLRAVISMREGKATEATNYLKNAFAKNPTLKAKALKDVEFAKLHAQINSL